MAKKSGLPELLKSDGYLDAIRSARRKESNVGHSFGVEYDGHAGLGVRRLLLYNVWLIFRLGWKLAQKR